MEQNTQIDGFKIHDIIAIERRQRTNEDGSKRGYNFYNGTMTYGVIVTDPKDTTVLKYKDPSGAICEYNTKDDADYYYVISLCSEILFAKEIANAFTAKKNEVDEKVGELIRLRDWGIEFKDSISILSKIKKLFI